MRNTLRTIALPTTIILFCALIGLSAYRASRNLNVIQGYVAQGRDASEIQSDLVTVREDLQAIETAQQGYLLTGDDSYRTRYAHVVEQLPAHFATLRSRLAGRPPVER